MSKLIIILFFKLRWPIITTSIEKFAFIIVSLKVIVPLPSWDLNTKEPITSDPEKYAVETELIFKYSPFSDGNQLMEQFNKIESSSGKHECPWKDT